MQDIQALQNHQADTLLYTVLCSFIIALSAQITVPLLLVPVTLQTLAVLMVSMLLGSRIGVMSVCLYLFEGTLGLPVFAGFSGGFIVLLGPTTGYLLGLTLTAYIAGFCAEHHFCKNFITTLGCGLLSLIPTFAFGIIVLSKFVGWNVAINFGLMPFILGEGLKLIFLATVMASLQQKMQ